MFDTMTMTKVVGGFCGALLVFLMTAWAAESIYHVGAGGHGEDHAQGYVIEVAEADDAGAAEEEGPAFEELYAAADPESGAKVFGKCRACHKIDGSNATGPHLDGVVDRAVDAVEGYAYSGALEEHFDVWTPANLDAFLEDPKGTAPGTKMTFAGLKKAEDRADLIAYLATLQ
ncbi:c-type cytochrome [Pseudooceanicola sp.]|uniref:c-type cytochrome n=1 Tax=Pseudooceanicola sp. TaxID=1914328 RepID=UPI004058CC9F